MQPNEIKEVFGKEALEDLYDVIMDRHIQDIADWVLMFYGEEEIGKWIATLREDKAEISESEYKPRKAIFSKDE